MAAAMSSDKMRIRLVETILCRIGWMDRYDGRGDLYAGRMEWDQLDAAKYGGLTGCGEAWNFKPGPDGIVRGFAMLTAKSSHGEYPGTINKDRLGANHADDAIDGILVIFLVQGPAATIISLSDGTRMRPFTENGVKIRARMTTGITSLIALK